MINLNYSKNANMKKEQRSALSSSSTEPSFTIAIVKID